MSPALRCCVASATAVLLLACITPSEFQALERDVAALKRGQGGTGGEPVGDMRVAELGAQVLELEREVAVLRGEIEETRHMAQEALEKSAAAPARSAAPAGLAETGRAAEGSGAPPNAGLSQTAVEVSEYEEAFRLYRDSDYRAAIERFNAFLQRYPTSDYADNALFWVGESWFKLEDFERAVLTFDEVARKYPDGKNWIPVRAYTVSAGTRERNRSMTPSVRALSLEAFVQAGTQFMGTPRM